MANSRDGHGHKDEFFDTIRKTLSQDVLICNMKTLICMMFLEVMTNFLFKRSNGLVSAEKHYHKEY